jgi:hypothetical protein
VTGEGTSIRSLWREPERVEQVVWPALQLHDVFKI